jgi:hypothetical protein
MGRGTAARPLALAPFGAECRSAMGATPADRSKTTAPADDAPDPTDEHLASAQRRNRK